MMRYHRACILAVALSLTKLALFAQESDSIEQSIARGKTLYETHCLACHQADGSGVPNLAPPLVEGQFVNGENAALIRVLLLGMDGVEIKGQTYFNPMPPFDYLTDQEIADVLTYVRNNFKNKGEVITPTEVSALR